MEVQTKAGYTRATHVPRTCNSNLEIKIAVSTCSQHKGESANLH